MEIPDVDNQNPDSKFGTRSAFSKKQCLFKTKFSLLLDQGLLHLYTTMLHGLLVPTDPTNRTSNDRAMCLLLKIKPLFSCHYQFEGGSLT